MSEMFKPRPSFSIRGSNHVIFVILKFQEVVSFEIGCLESHLPVSNDIIVFFFLIKIPQCFTREDRSEVEFFCFFINQCMIRPFGITWTVPKFN